jgi:hypothetical protein
MSNSRRMYSRSCEVKGQGVGVLRPVMTPLYASPTPAPMAIKPQRPQCILADGGARTPANSAILASRSRLFVAKVSGRRKWQDQPISQWGRDAEIARTVTREAAQAADQDFNDAALGLNRHIAFDEGNDIAAPCARGLPEHRRQWVPGAHHTLAPSPVQR